jgi:hypothetical protein
LTNWELLWPNVPSIPETLTTDEYIAGAYERYLKVDKNHR